MLRAMDGRLTNARDAKERSARTLARARWLIELLANGLAASTRTLERPEAVRAADGAASLLALAIDALCDGLARLAELGDEQLAEELAGELAGELAMEGTRR
jgi:hypothetical protein